MEYEEFVKKMQRAIESFETKTANDPETNTNDLPWAEWCELFCDLYLERYDPDSE